MIFDNLYTYLTKPVDTEAGSLINIPNFLIWQSVFMSANAILQAVADIVIEGLVLAEAVPFKLPLRVEFLFLTLISTVIAYLTLKGLREGDLDVTRNTMTIGLLVESSLVLGDIYLLFITPTSEVGTIFAIRIAFMVLTSMNIIILARILLRQYRTKRRRPNYRF